MLEGGGVALEKVTLSKGPQQGVGDQTRVEV